MTKKKTIKPVFSSPISIVLVGMMGVGKTTIGRRLAPKIDLPFNDADEEIEEAAGMKIADLFEQHGETHFRSGESQVIKRLLEGPPLVLATGGGAILNPTTRNIIKDKAISVWLKAPIPVIVERATRRATRPLLKQGDPTQIITKLLDDRAQFYAHADCHLDSLQGSHARTVNALVKMLKAKIDHNSQHASKMKLAPPSNEAS